MSSDVEQPLCESRLAKKGYYISFGNKKGRCYLEFRCNKKANTSGLCTSCQTKNPNCRTQDTRTFQHGRVWESIPEKSQIFGGQWYYESLEKNGEPLSVDIETAMKHQKEARKGYPQIDDMPPPAKKKVSTDQQQNTIMDAFDMSSSLSSLATNITDATEVSAASSPTSSSTPKKKKEADPDKSERSQRSQKSQRTQISQRAAPKRKIVAPPSDFTITLPVQVPDQIIVYPIYVEEVEEPYEIAEIEYINVSEFEYNNDLYYKCNEDNRIFEYLNDGGLGECIGIYEDNEIIDISQCEVEEEYA